MTRRFSVLLLLFIVIFSASAQDKPKKAAMPDIPGSFILDFGFNRAITPAQNFQQDFFGSRTVNIYYRYPIRFGKSKFSVVPSIGLSLERFQFSNNYTVNRSSEPDGSYRLIAVKDLITTSTSTSKSMLITNYFELPIGFRFDSKPEDIASSASIELGGRIGVLYQTFTKVSYQENDEAKQYFDEQSHGLNAIRYGLYGRLGIGGFNFFTFYNLSPLFAPNKGPVDNSTTGIKTNMNTFTFGISINGF
jgi:hypothetical protein